MNIINYHNELRDFLVENAGLKTEQIRFGNTGSTVRFHHNETYYARAERDEAISFEKDGAIKLNISPFADEPKSTMLLYGECIIFLKISQFAGDVVLLNAQLAHFLTKKQRIDEAEFDLNFIWNNDNSVDLHFLIEIDYRSKFESGIDGKGGSRSEC